MCWRPWLIELLYISSNIWLQMKRSEAEKIMVFLRGPKGTTWTLLTQDKVQLGVSAHLHASHRLSIV